MPSQNGEKKARPCNILQIVLLSSKVYPHVLSDNEDELFRAQFSFSFKIKEKAYKDKNRLPYLSLLEIKFLFFPWKNMKSMDKAYMVIYYYERIFLVDSPFCLHCKFLLLLIRHFFSPGVTYAIRKNFVKRFYD